MNASSRVYNDTDILIWVGQAYPTIESYIEEARRQGCSRRLPGLLRWIEPGRTRVFLAHRGDHTDPEFGSLFGLYTINSLHVVYDDITMGRAPDVRMVKPILRKNVKPPTDKDEVEEYIVSKKITFEQRTRKVKAPPSDPFAELVNDWIEDWLKEQFKTAIKMTLREHGIRHVPWSAEPDNMERLCGGASNMGSGRFPGTYASDEIGDWYLDRIIDWLLEDDELEEEYFWEEVVVEKVKLVKRRKHKKAKPGFTRSGRFTLEDIHESYGQPQADLSGLIVFDEPYPIYYHPPEASFRGIQRLDGDSLLLKVGLPRYIVPRTIPTPTLVRKLLKTPHY